MKGLMGVMAGVVIVSTVGFVTSRAPARPSEDLGRRPASTTLHADAPSVVLITLDGVRWQEIFRGVDPKLAKRARLPEASVQKAEDLLPSMYGLFFEGGTVLGDPSRAGGFSASGPRFISMPAYLELLTGAASDCKDNGCTPRLSQSLTDDVGGLPSVTRREDVAAFTSWEKLSLPAALPATSPGAAPAGVFVSAGRPTDDATPPFPGVERYRPDHATAAAAIGHLVKHQPRFLWVGLGDTDEWAHRGDYRGYLDALRFADRFIGEVAQHLAEMGEYGEKTMVFVTTDHGRDKEFDDHGGPASAGVWFMARGGGLPARGVMGTQAQRHLRDVAPTVRSLLGLPARQCAGCGEVMPELLPDGA